jgi:phytoene dehydrogenase-like protein
MIMYDTILIGKDVGILIAALASSSQGLRTILLSEGNDPAVYTGSGCTFNIDPFPWTGLGNGDSFLHFHLKNVILQAILPFFVPLNPGLQIILPENRLDIFSTHKHLIHEASREFPGREAKINALYEAALNANRLLSQLIMDYPTLRPGTIKKSPGFLKNLALYLREKSRCDRIFRAIRIRDDSMRLFFESQLAVLSNRHPMEWKYSLMSPHIITMPLQGVFYPLGGKQVVLDALEDLFVRQGGVLLKGSDIDRITSKTGLYQIEGRIGEETLQFSASHLIVSKAWKNMDRLLKADDRKARRFASYLKRSEKQLHPFTLYMSVLDKGLPEKMSEYVALIPDRNKPLHDLNFIFAELSRRGDYGRAPEGKRALSATVFLNKAPSSHQDSELLDLSDKLLKNLDEFLPFLSENIDFLDIGQCIDLSRKFEETATHRYRTLRRSLLHLSTLSSKTPLKNVYMTGKDIFPDLGFEGEVLSGLNAANLSTGGRL